MNQSKNMKRFFCFLIFALSSLAIQAQEKVKWEVSYSKEKNSILFTASIAEGWHLYSQNINNDIGPVPTSFTFVTADGVKLIDKVVEPTPIREYDENFEANLDFFKSTVTFTQKIDKKSNGKVTGTITYMVCNDVMCLPPVDFPFEITIP